MKNSIQKLLIRYYKVLINGAYGRYVVETYSDQINVLGIGARVNTKNMKIFQKLMNKMYDLNLQY